MAAWCVAWWGDDDVVGALAVMMATWMMWLCGGCGDGVMGMMTRSGRVPVSTAKKSSLRATTSTSTFRPVNTATYTNRVNVSKLRTNDFHKSHSPIRRPFHKLTPPNIRILNEKVNTVRVNGVNTAGQTAVSAVKGNGVTAIKASADIDGGFVAFGGSTRGGKITGKGKIRTDKLDFEDVFFVKELKFNLFSVSQMCDKKNSVLFTKTECLVLSPDFKLLDASQVLLRVQLVLLGSVSTKLIEALFEEKLFGTMCINVVDYTTWILRMECKSCQVMKMD
ncbi:hypothetical protein Tco_0331407 [Tanacetum coccineum]